MPSFRMQNPYYAQSKCSRSQKRKMNKAQAQINQQFEFIAQLGPMHWDLTRTPNSGIKYLILFGLASMTLSSLPIAHALRTSRMEEKFQDYSRLATGSSEQYNAALTLLSDNSAQLSIGEHHELCARALINYEAYSYPWHSQIPECTNTMQQLSEEIPLLGNYIGLSRLMAYYRTHFSPGEGFTPTHVKTVIKMIEQWLKLESSADKATFNEINPILYVNDLLAGIRVNKADSEHDSNEEVTELVESYQSVFDSIYKKHHLSYPRPRSLEEYSPALWGSSEHYKDALSLSSLLFSSSTPLSLKQEICSIAAFGLETFPRIYSKHQQESNFDLLSPNRFPARSANYALSTCLPVFQQLYTILDNERVLQHKPYLYFGLFTHLYETAKRMPESHAPSEKITRELFINASWKILQKWLTLETTHSRQHFIGHAPIAYTADYLAHYSKQLTVDPNELHTVMRQFEHLKALYLVDNANLLSTPIIATLFINLAVTLCILRCYHIAAEDNLVQKVKVKPRKIYNPSLIQPETSSIIVELPRDLGAEFTGLIRDVERNINEIELCLGKQIFDDSNLITKKQCMTERYQDLKQLKETLDAEPVVFITKEQLNAYCVSFSQLKLEHDYLEEFRSRQQKLARHYQKHPTVEPKAVVTPVSQISTETIANNQRFWQQQQEREAQKRIQAERTQRADVHQTSIPLPAITPQAVDSNSSLSPISQQNKVHAAPSYTSHRLFKPGEFTFSLADALPKPAAQKPDIIYLSAAKEALEAMRILCQEDGELLSDKARWGLLYHLMRFHHALFIIQKNDDAIQLSVSKQEARTIRNMIRHGYFDHSDDHLLKPYAQALANAFYKRLIAVIDHDAQLNVPSLSYSYKKPFALLQTEAIKDYETDYARLTQDIDESLALIASLFRQRDTEILFVHDISLHGALKMLISVIGENLKLLQADPKAYRHCLDRWNNLSPTQINSLLKTMTYSNRIGHHYDEQGEAKKQMASSSEPLADEPGGRELYSYDEIRISNIEAIIDIACILVQEPSMPEQHQVISAP